MAKYNLDKCKIIKELGNGMIGTTYLVKLFSKYYAMKIEKISKSIALDEYNTKYNEWREIEFSEKFGNKYPEQFIKLFSWDIIENCDYINPNDFSYLPLDVRKKLQEKNSSNFCIRKLYSLVDTNLGNIIEKLNKKQIYSLIIQTAHIIWLLAKKSYYHNDLHSENIGVICTTKKYIKILDKKISIPTCGYIFVGLDFGMMTNNTWELSEYEKKFKNKDIMRILTRLVKYKNNIDIGEKHTKKLLTIKDINLDIMDKIKNTIEWNDLDKIIIDYDIDDKILLFQILYPKIFQQIFFRDKFKKLNKLVYKIDTDDIIYFLKNKSNIKKIIKYFTCKIYNIRIN